MAHCLYLWIVLALFSEALLVLQLDTQWQLYRVFEAIDLLEYLAGSYPLALLTGMKTASDSMLRELETTDDSMRTVLADLLVLGRSSLMYVNPLSSLS